MSELKPGTVLKSRYEVDKSLAEGGMSRVYLGHPLMGAALVVIKELRDPGSDAERAEDLKLFESEYTILRMLDHPSLPLVIDFFEEGGRHYLVEEYVPGETLQDRLEAKGRFPPLEAAQLTLSLLEVFDYLHKRRIVYRDLKPSNVLLARDGRVRLIDFGAARIWREGALRDTIPLGTPGFAPPEQYGKKQTDERSDIYSVGAMLHFMLTGDDPQQRGPWSFASPHTLDPTVPEPLAHVAMRALDLDPAQRFPTAMAMYDAIAQLHLNRGGDAPLRLVNLRRRLRFTRPQDYYRVLETLGMGLFGAVFFAVSVPAWFANVPLPHPLVGLGVTAYAVIHPYTSWKRLRDLTVEIYAEGLRIETPDQRIDLLYFDIVKLEVHAQGSKTSTGADIYTRSEQHHLDGVWPGFTEVVNIIIEESQLTENKMGLPWLGQFVEFPDRTYERTV